MTSQSVDERLHPEAVIEAIAAILRWLVPLLRKNDIVVVFSNGGIRWDSREVAPAARTIGVQ
jgi:hypothetical protein